MGGWKSITHTFVSYEYHVRFASSSEALKQKANPVTISVAGFCFEKEWGYCFDDQIVWMVPLPSYTGSTFVSHGIVLLLESHLNDRAWFRDIQRLAVAADNHTHGISPHLGRHQRRFPITFVDFIQIVFPMGDEIDLSVDRIGRNRSPPGTEFFEISDFSLLPIEIKIE
jgi:hypothetical protein